MDDQIRALVRALPSLDIETPAGVARVEATLSVLSDRGTWQAIPVILPLAVARLWPTRLLMREADLARNTGLANAADATIERILRRTRVASLVGLDEHVRGHADWLVAAAPLGFELLLHYRARWGRLGPKDVTALAKRPETPTALLGLLACHSSGWVRERAVEHLATRGVDALPWLLVRTIDWVQPVRSRAARAVEVLLSDAHADSLFEVLPLVQRLRNFTRVDQRSLIDRIVGLLGRQPDARIDAALRRPDLHVRKAALGLLAEANRVSVPHLSTALRDRDKGVRLLAGHLAAALPAADSGALRALLLRDHAGQLRARGLELATAADPVAARGLLRAALTDEARSVRELARHLLRAGVEGVDIAEHYRAEIRTEAAGPGAVLGLGEVGEPTDWERLVPLLDRRASVARAAIVSLRRLDRRATRELRLMMVDDPRPGVSRSAARSLEGEIWASDEETLCSYLASPRLHVRGRTLQLVPQLPSWRPAYLLLPLREAALQSRVDDATRVWLQRRWHSLSRLTSAEGAQLLALLESATLLSESTRARFRTLLELTAPRDA